MRTLVIKIEMDNDAFHSSDGNRNEGSEVSRILKNLADSYDNEEEVFNKHVYDSNGNKVCKCKVQNTRVPLFKNC